MQISCEKVNIRRSIGRMALPGMDQDGNGAGRKKSATAGRGMLPGGLPGGQRKPDTGMEESLP